MPGSSVLQLSDGALIPVWVVPRAARSEITGWHGGRLKVRVSAPPEGGRANDEVARVLAECLGGPVELVSGASSREKAFLARGMRRQDVVVKLSR